MAKVTDAHVAARRQQILQAACTCFSRHGYHRTSVRDICRQAKLSPGAIYGYFDSKEEILEALAGLGRENTRSLLEAARTEDSAARSLAQLLDIAAAYLNTASSQEGVRLDVRLWGEALDVPRIRKLFLEALPNTCAPFASIFREGQERGELSAQLDADSVARVCVALCLGLQVQKALDPGADLAGCARVFAALFTGAFTAQRSEG